MEEKKRRHKHIHTHTHTHTDVVVISDYIPAAPTFFTKLQYVVAMVAEHPVLAF